MARRYITTVLGIVEEDIAIKHLERGVNFVLQTLQEKGITYRQQFAAKSRSDHRRFVYTDVELLPYEQSDEFSSVLNELSMQRMMKDLLA